MLMTPQDFANQWHEPLTTVDEKTLSLWPFSASDRAFLLQAGLPNSAAPFLNFDLPLKRIYEVWGHSFEYTVDEKETLEPYCVIGSDGSGSPIATDTLNQGRVVHLDHDDGFSTVTLMNSSIPQLAAFLLLTRNMIQTAHAELSAEVRHEGIPDAYIVAVLQAMALVDAAAMQDGCYWPSALWGL
jgi:SUKH-4 immunity protein